MIVMGCGWSDDISSGFHSEIVYKNSKGLSSLLIAD